jgi:hypothetical protein
MNRIHVGDSRRAFLPLALAPAIVSAVLVLSSGGCSASAPVDEVRSKSGALMCMAMAEAAACVATLEGEPSSSSSCPCVDGAGTCCDGSTPSVSKCTAVTEPTYSNVNRWDFDLPFDVWLLRGKLSGRKYQKDAVTTNNCYQKTDKHDYTTGELEVAIPLSEGFLAWAMEFPHPAFRVFKALQGWKAKGSATLNDKYEAESNHEEQPCCDGASITCNARGWDWSKHKDHKDGQIEIKREFKEGLARIAVGGAFSLNGDAETYSKHVVEGGTCAAPQKVTDYSTEKNKLTGTGGIRLDAGFEFSRNGKKLFTLGVKVKGDACLGQESTKECRYVDGVGGCTQGPTTNVTGVRVTAEFTCDVYAPSGAGVRCASTVNNTICLGWGPFMYCHPVQQTLYQAGSCYPT